MHARTWCLPVVVGLLSALPATVFAADLFPAEIKIDDLGDGSPVLTWNVGSPAAMTDPYNVTSSPETISFSFDLTSGIWGYPSGTEFYRSMLESDGSYSDLIVVQLNNLTNPAGAQYGSVTVNFWSDPTTGQIPAGTNAHNMGDLFEDGTFQTVFYWNNGSTGEILGAIKVASDVDVVPLPPAAWSGLALMGGLFILRRRSA